LPDLAGRGDNAVGGGRLRLMLDRDMPVPHGRSMAPETNGEEKRRLRAAMRVRRAAIAPAVRQAAGPSLVQTWRREQPVAAVRADGESMSAAGFWPIGDEIDLRPLLAALHEDGYNVLLPVTPTVAAALSFRRWTPSTAMAAGPFGTSHPTACEPTLDPDVLLVPLLAVDADGYRLGYGGGFYDRTLEQLRGRKPIIAIGVGFEEQRVDRVPRGAGDHRLDWLLTERRLLAFV
jgi:5-formyltetrahydrofolate cyclo-ligase